MPSTYISLALLCGGLMFYVYTHRSINKSSPASPAVKEMRPVVKRISPAGLPAVPLDKNQNDGKELLQSRLTKSGFSFFGDVLSRIAPVLKNIQ
ncbi:MAG TPA: hypothetical protein VHE59_11815 [Mucilaginibacter sp.]|nr:hypothetical protein [Mucilaginibacter sp.]